MHTHATHLHPGIPPHHAADLLDCLELSDDDHVLVIGDDTLDLMCALLRRGCGAVTVMRPHEGVRPEPVELVVVPAVRDAATAAHALALARRALGAGGRLVLHVPHDPGHAVTTDIARVLRAQAFGAVRIQELDDGTVLSAELPCFWSPRAATVLASRLS